MYNYSLSFLKKKAPGTYKLLKKAKNKLLFSDRYIGSLNLENLNLINNLDNESYYDYKKKIFIEDKDKKSKTGILEINNSCNINCVMCDTKSSTRKKKLMDLDLCDKSVKQMKEQGITNILLHTIGDPLANVRLKDYLQILRKYKMQVGLSTNGLMLDKHVDTLEEYFDVCSSLRFSIDGVKKSTYEKIRFGGKFEKLIESLELAENRLKKIGYEFIISLVVTKDNFEELGEFIIFFKKYVNNPYKNLEFHFMNSLSPNNDYFLKNNMIEEHTSKNFFCNFASNLTPYVLVDGNVSACCRDYDGSLIVDDIKENNLKTMGESKKFKKLQSAHSEESTNKVNDFELCRTCYEVDNRVSIIWNNLMTKMLYKHPSESSNFYQKFLNESLAMLKSVNKNNYQDLVNKYYL